MIDKRETGRRREINEDWKLIMELSRMNQLD